MKIFNNITDILRDDLKEKILKGSKVSVAVASHVSICREMLMNSDSPIKSNTIIRI